MSRHAKSAPPHAGTPGAHARAAMRPQDQDPYRAHGKPAEPSYCPVCGAVYEDGRWQWKERLSEHAPQLVCPACRRTREHFPAGYVRLEGPFVDQHRDELMQRIRHLAEHERAEHPLERILSTEDDGDAIAITTTGVRLARAIGQTLHKSYRGELSFKPSPGQDLIRVHWQR